MIGTVYYPPQPEFEGGELIVHTAGKDKAQYNRLIIFPAGQHAHRVTHVTNGTRYAIAINLWDKELLAVTQGKMTIE